MAVEVREGVWEVQSEVLELVPFDVSNPTGHTYPFNKLRKSASSRSVTLRTVLLENDFLLVTIVPDLGGRILQIRDKRTGIDVWSEPALLSPTESETGLLELKDGVLVELPGSNRTSMGPVSFSLYEPATEESSGGVIVSEVVVAGFDWQLCYSLSPERADVLLELRIHNRTFSPLPLTMGLTAGTGTGNVFLGKQSACCLTPERQAGFALHWETGMVESVSHIEGRVRVTVAGAGNAQLGPRETRTASLRLSALTSLAALNWFDNGVGIGTEGNGLLIQSDVTHPVAKIFVQCSDEKQLETTLDLTPQNRFSAQLDAQVSKVAVHDSRGTELAKFEHPWEQLKGVKEIVTPLPSVLQSQLASASLTHFKPLSGPPEPETAEQAFYVALSGGQLPRNQGWGMEAVIATARAQYFTQRGDFASAVAEIDRAVTLNGDDQLAWWLKAVLERLTNVEDEDRTSSLNAQFLAPLDPVLRAEAFLSTPMGEAPGPSPLVKPLAENPDALLDVVGLMVECGLYQDVARLIDESLKHRDCAMLRLVYAWCLTAFAKLDAEAAEQLRRSTDLPLEPPFPHRLYEVRAVRELLKRFPDNGRLKELSQLTDAFVTWF